MGLYGSDYQFPSLGKGGGTIIKDRLRLSVTLYGGGEETRE